MLALETIFPWKTSLCRASRITLNEGNISVHSRPASRLPVSAVPLLETHSERENFCNHLREFYHSLFSPLLANSSRLAITTMGMIAIEVCEISQLVCSCSICTEKNTRSLVQVLAQYALCRYPGKLMKLLNIRHKYLNQRDCCSSRFWAVSRRIRENHQLHQTPEKGQLSETPLCHGSWGSPPASDIGNGTLFGTWANSTYHLLQWFRHHLRTSMGLTACKLSAEHALS